MSKLRIPDGIKKVTLHCYKLDGIVTVTASYDEALMWLLLEHCAGSYNLVGEEFNVVVVVSKGSEKVSRKVGIEIAKRWLEGVYTTYDFTEGKRVQ